MRFVLSSFVAAVAFLPAASLASGFALEHHHARATGVATAYTLLADDPSAIFYNPAGLVRTKGTEVAVGDTLIAPSITFEGADGSKTSSNFQLSPPPHVFASTKIGPRVAAGIGVFSPFGASSSWP